MKPLDRGVVFTRREKLSYSHISWSIFSFFSPRPRVLSRLRFVQNAVGAFQPVSSSLVRVIRSPNIVLLGVCLSSLLGQVSPAQLNSWNLSIPPSLERHITLHTLHRRCSFDHLKESISWYLAQTTPLVADEFPELSKWELSLLENNTILASLAHAVCSSNKYLLRSGLFIM